MGFEINTLEFNQNQLNIWDIGGQKTLRSFWFNYFDKLDSMIWVIDLSNWSRIQENFKEFNDIISNEKLMGLKVLIYLNKLDLIPQSNIDELKTRVIDLLQLNQLDQERWKVQECSAYDLKSLHKGLEWLISS
ncbi:ADP-ribosylation factor [Wickerhamomyces ciferrii]|uniref:ADP-ribosylation factor n=1 Tax=Wickerhamomyces ciferrii (strain ATCC 14091 / BCRC 22168 / CBS 111 / JCM 3599 / NBRC 0793 / NRRL Y-1031 F-60-10) TaxID=1206466 RepID=K0KD43_WICCF|nr:ADP-ribosylation factor [Wickerhamomyces ciferrii]CCH40801.1 ADP-ribosylation factor [Wickerhamomyces ciferrii]